jgi:ribosomal protein S18 acetylase RimI-like enzyme
MPCQTDEVITLRKAVPDDAQAITEVRIETWNATYASILDPEFLASQTVEDGTSRLRTILEEEDQLPDSKTFRLVATYNGKVVGFSVCRNKPTDPFTGEWFLHALYIHPAFQGLGIGSKMIDAAKAEGRSRGATQMVLQVFSENEPAQKFYLATSAAHVGNEDFEIGGKSYPVLLFAYALNG